MAQEQPKISAIITVFNGEKYIIEALQSIIHQDYPNMEIIFVDDGSTDNTAALVQNSYPFIKYFHQTHSGIAKGKNTGVKNATGDYFSFLDADDFWVKQKTAKQLEMLLENPAMDMVFGYVKQFYSPELTEEIRSKYVCPENAGSGFHSGTMLIRRESFFKVGLFDEKWQKGIFNDWYFRAMEAGLKYYMFDDVLMMRRIHENNHGIVNRDKSHDYVRMLKASIDRKRGKTNG